MKTILTTLPIGFSVRNIVFTGVIDALLSRPDTRLAIVSSVPELADIQEESPPNLIYEPMPRIPRLTASRAIGKLLSSRFSRIHDNRSVQNKRRRLHALGWWRYLADAALSQPLPRSKFLYGALEATSSRLHRSPAGVKALFEKYRPDLVFTTHPTRMYEYDFLAHARAAGVRSVGLILSWDIPTTKGRIVHPMDRYLVWNRTMKSALVDDFGIDPRRVGITGAPQFDLYASSPKGEARGAFLTSYGLDPGRPTILFTTSPVRISQDEPAIIDRLAAKVDSWDRPPGQILVRVHPQDSAARHRSARDNVALQIPGRPVAGLEDRRVMNREDMESLRDALAYAEVVVNTSSTITIDAAAMDRPTINIDFDVVDRGHALSVRRGYEYEHYAPIVKLGAAKMARSFDDLIAGIARYLDDQSLERRERRMLAEAMCYRLDGRSAERVGREVLSVLDSSS